MFFCPKYSKLQKNNACNIKHMIVLNLLEFLDFEQNVYSRTSPW